jgi:hypothetical protein
VPVSGPDWVETVAVNVTACPNSEGFGVADNPTVLFSLIPCAFANATIKAADMNVANLAKTWNRRPVILSVPLNEENSNDQVQAASLSERCSPSRNVQSSIKL